MFRDSVIAAVRTGIAALVGLFITWLVGQGVDTGDLGDTLNVALFGVFTALYNIVVSLLEKKVNPYFGVLLGIPKAPAYGTVGSTTPSGATPAQVQAALEYVSPEVPEANTPPAPGPAAPPVV